MRWEEEIMKKREEEKEKIIKEFEPIKQECYDKLINGILQYVREGQMPIGDKTLFLNYYNKIFSYLNKGIETYLIDFHNEIIENASNECYEKINSSIGIDFINDFITYTERLYILIYYMGKLFQKISHNLILSKDQPFNKKKYEEEDISEFSMRIFKNNFFNKLENKLYIALNENLIREERNGNKEVTPKILFIMKTISYMDYEKPKINRDKGTIIWEEKSKNRREDNFPHQKKWFNDYFKQETIRYIKNKSETDIASLSADEYVQFGLKYLDEEKKRKIVYINKIFHKEIDDINYEYIIKNNAKQIGEMETGISYMFKANKKDELSNVYKLFQLYPESCKEITERFNGYIRTRGKSIYESKEISKDPKKFIPELISLKNEMNTLIKECFENKENKNSFIDSVDKAFSFFMNKEFYARQLANYVDFCMSTYFKGKNEEDINNILNEIMGLFKYLNHKISFQKESNKKLSERLLKKKSLSIQTEKGFITELKKEAGESFVTTMKAMIGELENNNKDKESYNSLGHKGSPNGIKLNVTVISQSAWEIDKKMMETIIIPNFLESCLKDYEKFYLTKYKKEIKFIRCLGFSTIEIQYLYLTNRNVSISTLPQLLSLLLLEQNGELTLKKISEMLRCQSSTITNDLLGLVYNPSFNPKGNADGGVISGTFDPNNKIFKESDKIYINKNFKSVKSRFNTFPLSRKKTEQELKESEEEYAQISKRYQDNIIQATITRIMKTRIGQENTHTWLVNETAKQIDLFKAQPPQIKENIEKLIEKNVIKRCEGKIYCYEYIA